MEVDRVVVWGSGWDRVGWVGEVVVDGSVCGVDVDGCCEVVVGGFDGEAEVERASNVGLEAMVGGCCGGEVVRRRCGGLE